MHHPYVACFVYNGQDNTPFAEREKDPVLFCGTIIAYYKKQFRAISVKQSDAEK
jgi:hypothetical protein